MAADPSSPLERSVWDQPIIELRRRETPGSARSRFASTLGARPGPRAYKGRAPRWSIAAAVGIAGLAALALVALAGQSGSAAPRALSPTSDARLATASNSADGAKRRSSSSQPASARHGMHDRTARGKQHQGRVSHATEHRKSNTDTIDTAPEDVPGGSGAETLATVEHSSATTTPVASVPRRAVQSAPVSSPSPSPSHASPPSYSQSSCVPGELGC
jgi:hypothetical protein